MPSLPKRLSCWLSACEKPPPLARSRLAPKAVPLPTRVDGLEPPDRADPPEVPELVVELGWSAAPPLAVALAEGVLLVVVDPDGALADGVPVLSASVVVVGLVPPAEL